MPTLRGVSVNDEVRRNQLAEWLETVEQAIALDPMNATMHYRRGQALMTLARYDEAVMQFTKLLAIEQRHFWAIHDCIEAFERLGKIPQALQLAGRLVTLHPKSARALRLLGRAYHASGNLDAAAHFLHRSLRFAPNDPETRSEMAVVADELGDLHGASVHATQAQELHDVSARQFLRQGVGVPLIFVLSDNEPRDSVHFQRCIDDMLFSVSLVSVGDLSHIHKTPPSTVVINGVGASDIAGNAYEALHSFLGRTGLPAINSPSAVYRLGMHGIAQCLSSIAHVRTPKMHLFRRTQLTAANDPLLLLDSHGFEPPFLIRSPRGAFPRICMRVETPEQLELALAVLPGDELWCVECIETIDSSGLYRKYRIMLIDGVPYPLHMAIGASWKVNFFDAETVENAHVRALEAEFLANMADTLGPTIMTAIGNIAQTLGLDYAGLDFTVHNGDVVVFECNAMTTLTAPHLETHWDYRQPAYDKILTVAKSLIIQRSSFGS